MKDNHKFKNLLKAAIVLSIAFAFIMPASAALFNVSNTESKKLPGNSGTISSTIYVDDDNTEGPWDGSMDYPYQYIQDGIDAATDGDEVYVFNGIYYENIVVFKYIYLTGENKDTTIIDGKGLDNVVEITADGVYLVGFTVKNSGNDMYNAGISIFNNEATISKNNIEDNNYGIRVIGSDNLIYFNNFERNVKNAFEGGNNFWCIYPLGGNYWDDYTGVDENEDGIGDTYYHIVENETYDSLPLIHWYGSVQNLDTKEIFLTIQSAINDGDTESEHTIFVKNDIYHEHVVIWKSINLIGENKHETIIDGRGFDTVIIIWEDNIHLTDLTIQGSGSNYYDYGLKVKSDENEISQNIIKDNFHGIYMKSSSDDNIISQNLIKNNDWNGIYVKSSCMINDGNIIFENTIENNGYAGIAMEDSSYNYIYHNNFMGNTHNAYDDSNNIWDDDYPSGGNYWDDYAGGDANGDGIGDTAYEIDDGINKDRYPLMEPYGGGDTTPPDVEIVSPQNGLYLRNLRLLSGLFKQRTIIFGPINIEVEASDYSGIEKVEFYIDDGSSPERILYEEPYIWQWEDRFLLKTKHEITVVAYDNEGNINLDQIEVRKFF